jgi:hypothetical protein
MLKSPLVISAWLPLLSNASRGVLTNKVAINISQDSLGVQARRVKSVTPINATMFAPRDVQVVLAHCDPQSPTQQWRVTPRAGSFLSACPALVTRSCNSSSPLQRFSFTPAGEIRNDLADGTSFCVDGSANVTMTSDGANTTGLRESTHGSSVGTFLRPCDGSSSQRWSKESNHTLRLLLPDGSYTCLTSNHYSPWVAVAPCMASPISRVDSANGRSNEIWTVRYKTTAFVAPPYLPLTSIPSSPFHLVRTCACLVAQS